MYSRKKITLRNRKPLQRKQLLFESLEQRRMLDATVDIDHHFREDDFEVSGTWTNQYTAIDYPYRDSADGIFRFDGHFSYTDELNGTAVLSALGAPFEIFGEGTGVVPGFGTCVNYGILHEGAVTISDSDGAISSLGGNATHSHYTYYNEPQGPGTCSGDAIRSSPFTNSAFFTGTYNENTNSTLSFNFAQVIDEFFVNFSTSPASLQFDDTSATDLSLSWAPTDTGIGIQAKVSGKQMDSHGNRSAPVAKIEAYYTTVDKTRILEFPSNVIYETPFDDGPIDVFWNSRTLDIELTNLKNDAPSSADFIEIWFDESNSISENDTDNNRIYIPLFDFTVLEFEGLESTDNEELSLKYEVFNPAERDPELELEILRASSTDLDTAAGVITSFTIQEVTTGGALTQGEHSIDFHRLNLGNDFANVNTNYILLSANRSRDFFEFSYDDNTKEFAGFYQGQLGGPASIRTTSDDDVIHISRNGGTLIVDWNDKVNEFDIDRITVITSEGADEIKTDINFDMPVHANGGAGNDIILGGNANDRLYGGTGHDVIVGGPGEDTIEGGPGNELLLGDGFELQGGTLDDLFNSFRGFLSTSTFGFAFAIEPIPGAGDVIKGGKGNEIIIGGDGGDVIDAGLGSSFILGDSFRTSSAISGIESLTDQDTFSQAIQTLKSLFLNFELVGEGTDFIEAGKTGANIVLGGGGEDFISGGNGPMDILVGNGARDTILGKNGFNFIVGDDLGEDEGGSGDDLLGGNDKNIIIGDSIEISAFSIDIEKLFSSGILEVYQLASQPFELSGEGNDTIEGGDGFDFLVGGGGSDTITGGDGFNIAFGDDIELQFGGVTGFIYNFTELAVDISSILVGSPLSIFSNVTDILESIENIFNIAFGDDETDGDTYLGGKDVDIVFGGDGNDTLTGGEGIDLLVGGFGNDTIITGTDASDPSGNVIDDIGYGGLGHDTITGSGGADFLGSTLGEDIFFGLAGNDFIFGGAGEDLLFGGAGDDYLNGQGGNDFFSGQLGDDQIIGGPNDDVIYGGPGQNNIDGSEGSNSISQGRLAADSDHDGDVDGADFLNWQRNFRAASEPTIDEGDTNLNGVVDGKDLAIWKIMFGIITPQPVQPIATLNKQALASPQQAPIATRSTELLSAELVDVAIAINLSTQSTIDSRSTKTINRRIPSNGVQTKEQWTMYWNQQYTNKNKVSKPSREKAHPINEPYEELGTFLEKLDMLHGDFDA